MKVTISHEHLSSVLDTADRAAAKKSPGLAILEAVLLEATTDGGLVGTGTDLKVRAWRHVPALVEAAGSVALPPARVASFLDAVPDDAEIRLTVDSSHKAVLTAGRTSSRIAGLDPERFPAGVDFDDPAFDLTIAADVLVGLIERTAHAAAKDDARPTLAGLSFVFDGAHIAVMGADGYRIGYAQAELPDGSDALSIIVPAKPLIEIARSLKDATSARLVVDSGGRALQIDSEAGCWSVLLIEGEFPDFKRVIPRDCPIAVTVSREVLLRALRLVRGLERTDVGYRVHLAFTRDSIEVTASDRQADHSATTTIDAAMSGSEALTVVFNTQYLQEAIAALPSDGVVMEMTASNKAVLIRAARDDGSWQVVMPMAIATAS